MTRFLTTLSLMILGIWAIAYFTDMPPIGIKSVHVLIFVFCFIGLLNGWSLSGGSPADFFFDAAIFVGFLWGSSSLIGKPIWVPFVVFGGILLVTWAAYFVWACYFYRYGPNAQGIGLYVSGRGVVMTSRAGKTEHEISREAKRLAKHV